MASTKMSPSAPARIPLKQELDENALAARRARHEAIEAAEAAAAASKYGLPTSVWKAKMERLERAASTRVTGKKDKSHNILLVAPSAPAKVNDNDDDGDDDGMRKAELEPHAAVPSTRDEQVSVEVVIPTAAAAPKKNRGRSAAAATNASCGAQSIIANIGATRRRRVQTPPITVPTETAMPEKATPLVGSKPATTSTLPPHQQQRAARTSSYASHLFGAIPQRTITSSMKRKFRMTTSNSSTSSTPKSTINATSSMIVQRARMSRKQHETVTSPAVFEQKDTQSKLVKKATAEPLSVETTAETVTPTPPAAVVPNFSFTSSLQRAPQRRACNNQQQQILNAQANAKAESPVDVAEEAVLPDKMETDAEQNGQPSTQQDANVPQTMAIAAPSIAEEEHPLPLTTLHPPKGKQVMQPAKAKEEEPALRILPIPVSTPSSYYSQMPVDQPPHSAAMLATSSLSVCDVPAAAAPPHPRLRPNVAPIISLCKARITSTITTPSAVEPFIAGPEQTSRHWGSSQFGASTTTSASSSSSSSNTVNEQAHVVTVAPPVLTKVVSVESATTHMRADSPRPAAIVPTLLHQQQNPTVSAAVQSVKYDTHVEVEEEEDEEAYYTTTTPPVTPSICCICEHHIPPESIKSGQQQVTYQETVGNPALTGQQQQPSETLTPTEPPTFDMHIPHVAHDESLPVHSFSLGHDPLIKKQQASHISGNDDILVGFTTKDVMAHDPDNVDHMHQTTQLGIYIRLVNSDEWLFVKHVILPSGTTLVEWQTQQQQQQQEQQAAAAVALAHSVTVVTIHATTPCETPPTTTTPTPTLFA